MCGIVGIYSPDKVIGNDVVWSMLHKIKHRGIKKSVRAFGSVKIGFTHLPITDKGSAKQPHEGEWTVYLNGQIYNYKELGSGTECEVISNGLQREGLEFVNKLNGMFAIVAINKGNVYLIRDRFGIKPMYVYEKDGVVAFASEIKAFLALPWFEVNISNEIKERWLTFNNTFCYSTLFEDVDIIPQASIWPVNGNAAPYFYHHHEFTQTYTGHYYDAVHKVRELLIKSIETQTPSDVKYGMCLSGGIDSNILRLRLTDCPAFTARFKGEDTERENAEQAPGTQYEILYSEVQNLQQTIYHLEDLRVGASWSNYGLYELASKFVTVLFDGAGADELFGGYAWRYDMSKNYANQILNRSSQELYYFFQDSIENRRKFDVDHFLHGVLLVCDKLSMARTIEMRLPYLDNDLWDFVTTLPLEWITGKKILKDAFPELPRKIKNAPKQGFSSPDWFDGEGNKADRWANAALNQWIGIFKPKNI